MGCAPLIGFFKLVLCIMMRVKGCLHSHFALDTVATGHAQQERHGVKDSAARTLAIVLNCALELSNIHEKGPHFNTLLGRFRRCLQA